MGGDSTDDDTSRKVFKVLTGIFLTIVLVGLGIFLININPNITGLAVADDEIEYCRIKDDSILIYVEPDINCKYIDSNKDSVKIEFCKKP